MGFKAGGRKRINDLAACKKDELSSAERAELSALAKGKHSPGMIANIAANVEGWKTDAYVCEGDLHLDSFDSITNKVALLVVKGNLIVDGHYRDCDHPESLVIVTGDLIAGSLVTAGWIEVHGNVEVEGELLGDYNDCSAEVFGDMKARFIYPEEHFFKVHGAINAQHIMGIKSRLESGNALWVIDSCDEEALKILDKAFFCIERDEDGELIDMWLEDFGELKSRVARGESIYANKKKSLKTAVTRLEFHEGSSNKFWQISVNGPEYTVCYGRIGTEGQTKAKSFASAELATLAAASLLGRKRKKGYR